MGIHAYVAKVPFAIYVEEMPEVLKKFFRQGIWPLDANGWFSEHNEWLCDIDELHGVPAVKGNIQFKSEELLEADHKVFYVQTGYYSEDNFVSYDRKSLELFCDDFGLNKDDIEEDVFLKNIG